MRPSCIPWPTLVRANLPYTAVLLLCTLRGRGRCRFNHQRPVRAVPWPVFTCCLSPPDRHIYAF